MTSETISSIFALNKTYLYFKEIINTITVGNQDNFLLNYPVKFMEAPTKELKSTFQFAYYAEVHFTLATPEYRKKESNFCHKNMQNISLKTAVERNKMKRFQLKPLHFL